MSKYVGGVLTLSCGAGRTVERERFIKQICFTDIILNHMLTALVAVIFNL